MWHRLSALKTALLIMLPGTTMAVVLPAQTLTTLFNFSGAQGANPTAPLVQAANGDLYGTTSGVGTIFKVTPSGTLTTIYAFCSQSQCADGSKPYGGLVQATNGSFYGTTIAGGTHGGGTVFKITPGGALTTLYSFCSKGTYLNCPDGASPYAGLVQASSGDLYGTTSFGGLGGGTIFKITPTGTLTTLYEFCLLSECADGSNPGATLIQASNGALYGTTIQGGIKQGQGTIFQITPNGEFTTIYSFCSQVKCADGAVPQYGPLVQGKSGELYGTTSLGGTYHGTAYKITPSGSLTTLCSFSGVGQEPYGMILGSDGNFYGSLASGVVFQLTPDGRLTSEYNFGQGIDPVAGVMQATNGTFYGTTKLGGEYGDGTIFSLSAGLGPFVETRPQAGTVGEVIEVLGNDLADATSVSFNGILTTFNAAKSVIAAPVPQGAVTGTVEVFTPRGNLSTILPFRVLP